MGDSGSGSYTYQNLVIDYGLLNDAANDISALSPEITKIKNAAHAVYRGGETYSVPGQTNDNNLDLGPSSGGLYFALGRFYGRWGTDMSNAMDSLEKMAGYFKGVADSFMETDASQAAGLNMSSAMSAVLRYPLALDQWYTDKANAAKENVPFTETQPVAPTSPFVLADGSGGPNSSNNAVTTYTTQADPNVPAADKATNAPNVVFASETTTVTVNGMTYKETTTFDPDQGWGSNGSPTQNTTQVIDNPDGSTDTVTTTTDTGGKGSMTDVNSGGTTSTYTRADWNSPWVDTTPPADSSSSGGDGPDPAPFVD